MKKVSVENDQELLTILKLSIVKLRKTDSHLFESNVNERSISHKLAEILQKYFGSSWHVDCEYNRDGHNPKCLHLAVDVLKSDCLSARTVYPDIIVHKRNTSDNLIVIEIKKSTNEDDRHKDFFKLKAFKNELKYKFCVFIEFSMTEQNDIILINNQIPDIDSTQVCLIG